MFGYVSAYTVESRNVLHGNTRKSTVKRAMHGGKMPSEGRGQRFESSWVRHFPPLYTCRVFGNVYGYVTKRAGMLRQQPPALTTSNVGGSHGC